MPTNLPLKGKTIILTGSAKTTEVKQQVRENGGTVAVFPLIRIQEHLVEDDVHITEFASFNWLIFTSQNAVEAFIDKINRAHITAADINSKVAAVGTKTAALLEAQGFTVHFIPSIFSADVFVQEFPAVAGDSPRCLFLRGSLAKPTIKEGLPFDVVEWTVYETVENREFIEPFIWTLQETEAIVIFASPSAVKVFDENIVPMVGWNRVKAAAIGHITASALQQVGVSVYVQPETYTMQAVIEQLILEETKQ
ncbi:uroporphyrinogen-III synthase [Solibacillus sp. FSL H8-0538]|uniref:uroporphyrinogen-III synthase n=1 Tax=Solibacillus sp. FSL H8-0538 TaxID=2921400 RepID=UPI0030FA8281